MISSSCSLALSRSFLSVRLFTIAWMVSANGGLGVWCSLGGGAGDAVAIGASVIARADEDDPTDGRGPKSGRREEKGKAGLEYGAARREARGLILEAADEDPPPPPPVE